MKTSSPHASSAPILIRTVAPGRRRPVLPPAVGWTVGLIIALALWAEPIRLALSQVG